MEERVLHDFTRCITSEFLNITAETIVDKVPKEIFLTRKIQLFLQLHVHGSLIVR